MNDQLNRSLDRAKIGLMTEGSVFLMTVAFNLNHVFNDKIPTACTNGLQIEYNPDFFMGLSHEERISLIIHETWHVALMHMTRNEHKDKVKYNKAADYVINQMIKDDGFAPLPSWLQNDTYRNMSTDQVYNLLEDDDTPPPMEDLADPGDGVNTEEVEKEIEQILIKAQVQSELSGEPSGSLPGEIDKLIKELIDPELPWEQILSRFLNDQNKSDYSWKKPNRRYMPDFYLPSQISEQLEHLTFAIDTSGSVSDKDLVAMLSEINYIKDVMKPNKMTIIDCDNRIHHIHEVDENTEILDLTFTGSGGTSCYPVMEYCNTHDTTALIYFTDLYMADYNKSVEYPVLWIVYNNPDRTSINIGEITHYDISNTR